MDCVSNTSIYDHTDKPAVLEISMSGFIRVAPGRWTPFGRLPFRSATVAAAAAVLLAAGPRGSGRLTFSGLGPVQLGARYDDPHGVARKLFPVTHRADRPECFYAEPLGHGDQMASARLIITHQRLAVIETMDNHISTDEGIGVGSSEADIRKTYAGKQYTIESIPFGEPGTGNGYFLVVSRRMTVGQLAFAMTNSKLVRAISVGLPDSPMLALDGCE